jgi:organic hydroperoxide reductase OsmC/OhrA
MMKTYGAAAWQGGIKDGKGAISTRSGALKECPYGFGSRFEGKPGTNPEDRDFGAGCLGRSLTKPFGGWRTFWR